MMTIKEVSELTGVSTRTLRYYDDIGLFHPTQKTDAGYRLYDDEALTVLRQIIFLRELDLPLATIKDMLTNPLIDRNDIIIAQKKILTDERKRLERLFTNIDNALKGAHTLELKVLSERISKALEDLKQFTATPGNGVTRFPFTDEARKACDYLKEYMESVGLKVYMDNSGSVIGRLEGEVKDTVMIGSHQDSVKFGGAYDGIAGVVCGIEAARLLVDNGVKPYYSIEVIATNDEEGSRFKSGLFTGKVLDAQLTVDDIKRYKDADGISVYDAMKSFGLKPDEIAEHKRSDIKAFLEMHIEQGPILEAENKDIGVVDVIVGIKRLLVTINGRADHIGTMPMNMRKDAIEAATKVISNIGDRSRYYPLAVATVGNLNVYPNIINIIPEKVTFTVDFRGTTQDVIEAQATGMIADLDAVTNRFQMSYTVEETLNVAPVELNSDMRSYIEQSCVEHGFSNMHIVSGAGHDAQVFGARMPAAMIFVPSKNGRSHCPEEYTDPSYIAMAVCAAYDTVTKICQEKKL